jgi:ankyrin repeat protein/serine/threonine protein kinase
MSGRSIGSPGDRALGHQQKTKWLNLSDDEKKEIQGEVLDAAVEGDISKMKSLIKQYEGLRLDYCVYNDDYGDTTLHLAALHGHMQIVKYLIVNGYRVIECENNYKHTPLHRAAKGGNLEVVKYLIEEKNCDRMRLCDWGRTPLHYACESENARLDLVQYLMNLEGVNVNVKDARYGFTPLDIAAEYGTVDVVKYMIEEKNCFDPANYEGSNAPLNHAAFRGNLPVVKYLVEKRGFDVNVKGLNDLTPLHSACRNGKLELVKYLMENKRIAVNAKDKNRSTPLDLAAEYGTLDVVQYMVDKKNCEMQFSSEKGYTPLHCAARGGKLDIVKYLIENKRFNPNCNGHLNRTPLNSACSRSKYDVVEYLIVKCGVTSSRDKDGSTPLHSAVKNNKCERSVVELLITEFDGELEAEDFFGRDAASMAKDEEIITHLQKAKQLRHSELRNTLKERLKVTKAIRTGTVISKGAFSSIIELKTYATTGERVAGKVLQEYPSDITQLETTLEAVTRNAKIITTLSHENVVGMKGVSFLTDRILPVLLMERMMSSLQSYLQDYPYSLSVNKSIGILRDIACGLQYLHSLNPPYIHGHLTAENILVNERLKAKIGGFSIISNYRRHLDTTYMPPATEGGDRPSLDVFSFGHLALVTILQEKVGPLLLSYYINESGEASIRQEVHRRATFMKKAEKILSENNSVFELIKVCLSNVPSERPSASKLLQDIDSCEGTSGDEDFTEDAAADEGGIPSKAIDFHEKMSIEKAESIVQEMLQKEGKFMQKNMVVVLTGLMEAGKTTLLCQILNEPLPDKYSSTGVAEKSCRAVTHHTVDMKDKVLKLLKNPEDMFELVVRVKKKITKKSTTEEELKDSTSAAVTNRVEESIANLAHEEASSVVHEPTSEISPYDAVGDSTLSGKSPALRKYVDMVRKNPDECYGELELVHMIDTGGQPECLAVMPTFIHHADLILLVINLSHLLDECITPTFHKDGQKFEKGPLIRTNKEIINQLAHTMAGRSNSKILVVATHKDEVPEKDFPKVLEDLNGFVAECLPSDSLMTNKGQVVFDIDLLHPDKTLDTIRETIINVKVKPLEVPSSFVLLEIDMQHSVSDKKRKVEVLEFKECVEIGKKLHMTEETIEAALTYFHRNNVLLFFKEIGPGLIFVDPKILISFVDNVIKFSYTIIEGEDIISPALTKSQVDTLRGGMVPKDLFEHKNLTENLVPDLFQAEHAIEIFKQFYIIAEGRMDYISKDHTSVNYIMMCLLCPLREPEYKAKIKESTKVEPLFIEFRKEGSQPNWKVCCSPNGCFGGTIACLISIFNWTICTDFRDEKPECLYRDVVMLQPNRMKLKITLINTIELFEVYVESKAECKQENISRVRKELVCAVKKVLETMKMDLVVGEGIECTCGEKIVFHLKYLPESSEECAECKYGHSEKPESLWAKGEASQKTQSAPVTAKLDIDDLFEVVSELQPVITRWKHIGLALRLSQGQLKKIEKEHKDDLDDCLSDTLSLWLNKSYKTEKVGEPTWKLLAKAVSRPAGGNNPALAEGIRQRHTVTDPPSKNTTIEDSKGATP